MQLSKKDKNFSQFFSAFLKSILTFQHFQKKDNSLWRSISEIMVSEKRG